MKPIFAFLTGFLLIAPSAFCNESYRFTERTARRDESQVGALFRRSIHSKETAMQFQMPLAFHARASSEPRVKLYNKFDLDRLIARWSREGDGLSEHREFPVSVRDCG